MTPPLLEVRNVSKSFPGVRALTDVSLSLGKGEVLALLGENGAGKSTLMKILGGVQSPDQGQILLDGREVRIDSVTKAMSLGISLIHQELNLSDNLDVGSNLFLGREPHTLGFVDRRKIDRDSVALLEQVGLKVSPRTLVRDLSIGQKQLVEIAKALSTHARVLIMDEPTSSLSQHETLTLFGVVKKLRAEGVSIVYISHRLGEVRELADRAVALRDGKNAGELAKDEIDHDRMIKLMVGRQITKTADRAARESAPMVLEAENLVIPGKHRHPLQLSIRSGEIVGMAGLVGAGRTELLRVLFGVERPISGSVRVAGRPVVCGSPRDAIRAGIALVPEDRKQQGLILEMTVRENLSLADLWRSRLAGMFISYGRERSVSREMVGAMNVKTAGDGQCVQLLSGGNQQKVVLGKWLAMKPRVLLLDEPTRGVDVGAKQEIYQIIHRLADTGVAVLFVSSDMEEVLGLSDRAYVMHEGRISGQLARSELCEEAVMRLATGGS